MSLIKNKNAINLLDNHLKLIFQGHLAMKDIQIKL